MDWMTEPGALEVLITLGGILPGDELKLKPCNYDFKEDAPFLCVGVVKVTRVMPARQEEHDDERWVAVAPGVDGTMIVVPENIAGWRRLSTPTTSQLGARNKETK